MVYFPPSSLPSLSYVYDSAAAATSQWPHPHFSTAQQLDYLLLRLLTAVPNVQQLRPNSVRWRHDSIEIASRRRGNRIIEASPTDVILEALMCYPKVRAPLISSIYTIYSPLLSQFLISNQGPTRSVVNISKKRLVSFVYIYTTYCSGPLQPTKRDGNYSFSFRISRCGTHLFVGPDHRAGVDTSTHSHCIRSIRANIATSWFIHVWDSQALTCCIDVVMDNPAHISKQHRTFYKR